MIKRPVISKVRAAPQTYQTRLLQASLKKIKVQRGHHVSKPKGPRQKGR